jgi:hypothetical protein
VIPERLRRARHYLEDAEYLLAADRVASAVSRAYYAAYQGMWAALGDPPRGELWRHGAIINHFVRGYWFVCHPAGTGLLKSCASGSAGSTNPPRRVLRRDPISVRVRRLGYSRVPPARRGWHGQKGHA